MKSKIKSKIIVIYLFYISLTSIIILPQVGCEGMIECYNNWTNLLSGVINVVQGCTAVMQSCNNQICGIDIIVSPGTLSPCKVSSNVLLYDKIDGDTIVNDNNNVEHTLIGGLYVRSINFPDCYIISDENNLEDILNDIKLRYFESLTKTTLSMCVENTLCSPQSQGDLYDLSLSLATALESGTKNNNRYVVSVIASNNHKAADCFGCCPENIE